MKEPYIDLMLKPGTQQDPVKNTNEESNEITFEEAIEQSQLTVILGVPGSGKTTLLEHYHKAHQDSSLFYTVHEWLDVDDAEVNNGISCILIDGFDELRIDGRHSNAINKVIRIMKNYVDKVHKFVLSCRAMDWFENQDRNALEKAIHSVSVFYIQPLTGYQIKDLIHQLLNDPKTEYAFLNTYSQFDFLNNPEIVNLLIDIYTKRPKDIPKTKKDVYEYFISLSNRHVENSDYRNDTPMIEDDQIFKYAGYLAYFYLISSCNNDESPSCNNNNNNYSPQDFFKDIASSEHGYPISSLENVCRTKIFNKDRQIEFQHRTIAEYLCAHFLYYELSKNKNLSLRRIFGLLLSPDEKRVRSELRGVYAWLCAFSEKEEYFKIDPYNQLLYGDNSHFSLKNKQSVLKAIREFSQTEPYFLEMDWYRTPKDFYTPELDEFLIQKYREAWEHPNHYLFLLSDLMLNAEDNPSSKLKDFAFEVICHPTLPNHYKVYFVYLLKTQTETLKDLLAQIESNSIKDDNNELLDRILGLLYPKIIGPDSILDHIKQYKHTEEQYLRFHYLFTVTYPSLKQLAVNIIKEYPDAKSLGQFNTQIDNYIANFWCKAITEESSDFILKTLIEALSQNWLSARSSWHSAFNNSEHWYKPKEFTMNISNEIKANLFDKWLAYLQQQIDNNQEYEYSWQLEDCISLLKPNNQLELLKSHLSKKNSDDYNHRLFSLIRNFLVETNVAEQEIMSQLLELASQIGFKQKYEKSIKPNRDLDTLKIERQQNQETVRNITELQIQENDKIFSSMSQVEIDNALEYFNRIIPFYLFDNMHELPMQLKLSENIYNELLDILKLKLSSTCDKRIYAEYANITSMSKEFSSVPRDVDRLYYAITCLNDVKDYSQLTDTDFIDYLYMVNFVLKKHFRRISNFCSWYESSGFDAKACILNFISSIPQSENGSTQSKNNNKQLIGIVNEIIHYLNDNLTNLSDLEQLLILPAFSSCHNKEDFLIQNFVEQYNYQIPIQLIKIILDYAKDNSDLQNSCTVLLKFTNSSSEFTLNDVIRLHTFIRNNDYASFINFTHIQKFTIIKIFLDTFNKSEMLQFHSGIQTSLDECADFINQTLWDIMSNSDWVPILYDLLKFHKNDIWTNRIKHQIYLLQSRNNNESASISIPKAKYFIFNTGYASPKDFWLDVCEKLYSINNDIQTSDSNHVNAFYNFKDHDCKHKSERDCRDILFNIWNFTHSNKILAEPIREYYVGNDKRVDFTLRSRKDLSNEVYSVHIECKIDDNRAIKFGIPEQLIKFYLKNNPNNYGVYYIFCFQKNPDELKEVLKSTIPPGYTDRIEVICLDLRKK